MLLAQNPVAYFSLSPRERKRPHVVRAISTPENRLKLAEHVRRNPLSLVDLPKSLRTLRVMQNAAMALEGKAFWVAAVAINVEIYFLAPTRLRAVHDFVAAATASLYLWAPLLRDRPELFRSAPQAVREDLALSLIAVTQAPSLLQWSAVAPPQRPELLERVVEAHSAAYFWLAPHERAGLASVAAAGVAGLLSSPSYGAHALEHGPACCALLVAVLDEPGGDLRAWDRLFRRELRNGGVAMACADPRVAETAAKCLPPRLIARGAAPGGEFRLRTWVLSMVLGWGEELVQLVSALHRFVEEDGSQEAGARCLPVAQADFRGAVRALRPDKLLEGHQLLFVQERGGVDSLVVSPGPGRRLHSPLAAPAAEDQMNPLTFSVMTVGAKVKRLATMLAVPTELLALDRSVALAMALHPRLGGGSRFRALEPGVLAMIARLAWEGCGRCLVMDAGALRASAAAEKAAEKAAAYHLLALRKERMSVRD